MTVVGVGSDPVAGELDGDRPRGEVPSGRSLSGDRSARSGMVPSPKGESLTKLFEMH